MSSFGWWRCPGCNRQLPYDVSHHCAGKLTVWNVSTVTTWPLKTETEKKAGT